MEIFYFFMVLAVIWYIDRQTGKNIRILQARIEALEKRLSEK